ncbi:MAG TPA: potassium-transporting ATPase subunit KdpA [Acetobacteraceae bacterium]|nr:potassium-transporting ATPase subunit KdpA [Acetobacteraceae bacterium]
MSFLGWAQLALPLAIVLALAFPFGKYMSLVFAGERTWLTPVLAPVERGFYAASGVDPKRGMGWKEYVFALLLLNALHFLLLYAILRLQYYLPWNPQGITGMSPRLAFNTAASFVTNTNWQAYSPESQVSYGAQMIGLTVHNFLSAASGIAAAVAVMRAFAGGGLKTLGNFYADMTRCTLYILLPVVVVCAVFFIASGMPENLSPYASATTLEGANQTIALGPVAFQEAIKEFGTNGGGFFNANSSHPFENPTALTNLVENILDLLIAFSLAIMLGHVVGEKKQGRALFYAMAVLLCLGAACAYTAESGGNPLMAHLGVNPAMGNMEGKEVRFGVATSDVFNVSATGTSTGAVDSFTDSYMPLAGLVPMFLMQLGEVTPGGVGSGLYTIVVFALLSVFVAGLMVGRTPEYLGKKVQAREIKLAMLAVLILTLCILGGAGYSITTASGLASLTNAGPHGLSEMLYGWTSATENNGSAMAGLSADTPLLDFGLGLAMILGRFGFMVPVMAIAGSLAAKPKLPPSAGTFPTTGLLFVGLLMGVIIILGGLQFMPADALGPLAEHFEMLAGKTY